ncbi:MAG: glycosyltransferase [Parvularculaceae bacterium]
MPRFFIVDPSLRDMRGHHFALSTAAAQSAAVAGFEPWWLCAKSVASEFESPDAKIHRTFGATMYENYTLTGAQGGRGPDRTHFRRVLSRIARVGKSMPHINTPRAQIDLAATFARELRHAMREIDFTAADRILIHTADGATFTALASLTDEMSLDETPVFHVATPYDPVGVMPNRISADDVLHSVRSYLDRGLIDRKIFLYGENGLLAKHLASLWSVPVRALPLPAAAPLEEEIAAALAYRRDQLGVDDDAFLVISLGSARIEKGFDLFPEIIRSAVEGEARCPSRLKFVLHASAQIIGRHPAIAATLERLQSFPKQLVKLLLDPLSEDEYRSLLLACDAVVLPYRRQDYLYRSSGIVTEAIAAGKILIATKDSYPGAAAMEAGALVASTPEAFGAAIIRAAIEKNRFVASAIAARDSLLAENSTEDYVPKLLRSEAIAFAC